MARRTIRLDGSRITNRKDMAVYMKEIFSFPETFGGNLDALHDVLAECANGTEIVFENSTQTAPGMQGDVEALRWMCSETMEEYPEIEIEFK